MANPLFQLVITFLVSVGAFFYFKRRASRFPLPPGLAGLPILGNVFQIPDSFEWITYHKWSKQLETDILYLNVAGQAMIVLDTAQVASDLLDKRSSIYSSRPRFPMLNELSGGTFNTGTMKYGMRQHRQLFHQYFGPNSPSNYKPHVTRAARNLLNKVLDDPQKLKEHLRYMAGDVIMSICYGLDVSSERGSSYLKVVEKGVQSIIEAGVPGRFLVDALPILKYIPEWVPGAAFQRKAREWKHCTQDMLTLPFQATKQQVAAGTCPPCFTCDSLQKFDANSGPMNVNSSDNFVKNTAGTMYMAGSDTTVAALASCILGLLGRPDVLKRARADLDRVIEPGHLPDLDDMPSLPFITAIAKEALRWRDVTPIGLPHYVEVEDEYRGYRIPAGSVLIANCWAMLHDESVYPSPFLFKPERFMNGDALNPDVKDPDHACFGFGRRICAGRFVAFPSIWITIASLIYVFEIEREVDENGCEIDPQPEYTSGIVVSPKPFPCNIKPRSPDFVQLIRENLHKNLEDL
ncbi:cytochrome P450 [Crepidotus variabilis]|uniref:Cytochrome P450 n=1 Tax=Crepidotus variabilis TaxID=179855 RepID=A0A9P6E4J7_9AGAR|nr:cytochrome P450 [Crepidotus variabilis]